MRAPPVPGEMSAMQGGAGVCELALFLISSNYKVEKTPQRQWVSSEISLVFALSDSCISANFLSKKS